MKLRALRNVALAVVFAPLIVLAGCGDREGVERTDRLLVWTTESDTKAGQVMARIEAAFERRHSGVDLVVETVSWGDVSERLINASQSGDWPDVSHIQPFMAYSLYERDQLLPLTDLRNEIEAANGPIFPAVRDLQAFGPRGEVYGIAYAVGTTFWSVLAERLPPNEDLPRVVTWDDYLNLARRAHAADPQRNRITLPGAAPFFMDQLFGELVANAGGRLFGPDRCPLLTSPQVVSVLTFFRQLKEGGLLADDWSSQTYTDQFVRLANGPVFSVPVTYARSSQSVREAYRTSGRNPANANERTIRWLDQPVLRPGLRSIATIDAEPWVVFAAAARRQQADGQRNSDLAMDFLRMFYASDNYAAYTRQVPVHLTPIFERMANDPDYVAATRPFEEWHRRTLQRLSDGSTRPILMPDLSQSGRSLPFLLEFQRAGILSGAIADVIQGNNTAEAAAARAQQRAIQLVQRTSNIRCAG